MGQRQIFNPAEPVQIRDMNEMFRELFTLVNGLGRDAVNALAVSGGSTAINPDTAQNALILSNHARCPGSGYWYVQTVFDGGRTGPRAQTALQYSGGDEMYLRRYAGGTWSSWKRVWSSSNLYYETGSWTPVLRGETGNPTYTGNLSGTYMLIGDLVMVAFFATNLNITSAGSGRARISNLPFTAHPASYNGLINMPVHYNCFSRNDVTPVILGNQAHIELYGGSAWGTTTWATGTNAQIRLTGIYRRA